MSLGLLDLAEREVYEARRSQERRLSSLVASKVVDPAVGTKLLVGKGEPGITEPQRISELVKRPTVSLADLLAACGVNTDEFGSDALASSEIQLKYAGYLDREREAVRRLDELADFRIPVDLPYEQLLSLSTEAREKLSRVRPQSLAQAGRVPGVSPSDLQNLVSEVVRRRLSVA
jgi:tRNA uridine 5-carboxymethylaminomethyl modification enzyme